MAKIGVSLKINVSQIDKNRLFKGQKGTYLDATVFIDIDQLDQYGNSGMITQDVSKEEKAQQVKGAILGNCKVFWNDGAQAQQTAPQQQQAKSWGNAPPQQAAPQKAATQQQATQYAPVDNSFDDKIPF